MRNNFCWRHRLERVNQYLLTMMVVVGVMYIDDAWNILINKILIQTKAPLVEWCTLCCCCCKVKGVLVCGVLLVLFLFLVRHTKKKLSFIGIASSNINSNTTIMNNEHSVAWVCMRESANFYFHFWGVRKRSAACASEWES